MQDAFCLVCKPRKYVHVIERFESIKIMLHDLFNAESLVVFTAMVGHYESLFLFDTAVQAHVGKSMQNSTHGRFG
jgi:hypothetical protein